MKENFIFVDYWYIASLGNTDNSAITQELWSISMLTLTILSYKNENFWHVQQNSGAGENTNRNKPNMKKCYLFWLVLDSQKI